jgi:hypothetical protein
MKEIEEYIETCDEVFHEAARGVLVAYDRIKVLRPKTKDKTQQRDKVDEFVEGLKNGRVEKIEKKPEPLQLSFQERVRWPLFQRRMVLMMEGLMNAKQDLTLHLLVYWVNWEHEHKKRLAQCFLLLEDILTMTCRSRSSIFSALSTSNRDALIEQLWQSKVRRDQDSNPHKTPLSLPRSVSSGSSGAPSIFALSNSGSISPEDRRSYSSTPPTDKSDKSERGFFSRLARKLSLSSSKKLTSVGLGSKKKESEMTGRAHRSSANDTWNTRTVGRSPPIRPSLLETASMASMSASTDMNSMHSARPGLHRSASARSALRGPSPQTRNVSPMARPQRMLTRKTSWSAGPTMGAKQGIVREWEALKGRHEYREAVEFSDDEDDSGSLPWSGTEDELEKPYFRALGRELLFRQLESMTPTWAVPDGDHAMMTIDMLVEQWIEPGQFRRRRMEWENIVDGKRAYAPSSSEGTLSSSGDGTAFKFHFSGH